MSCNNECSSCIESVKSQNETVNRLIRADIAKLIKPQSVSPSREKARGNNAFVHRHLENLLCSHPGQLL